MTLEDRDILIADLCGRLPYGVMVKAIGWDVEKNQDVEVAVQVYSVNTDGHVEFGINDYDIEEYLVDDCKPYLRPMSSMTEEEMIDFLQIKGLSQVSKRFINDFKNGNFGIMGNISNYARNIDWLNKKMFDFRGLIPKGQAIEITEENNPYI